MPLAHPPREPADRWCNECQTSLPRSAFSRRQWQMSAGRRCSSCTGAPPAAPASAAAAPPAAAARRPPPEPAPPLPPTGDADRLLRELEALPTEDLRDHCGRIAALLERASSELSPIARVFENQDLLAMILRFNGALAPRHAHYSLVDGFHHRRPRTPHAIDRRLWLDVFSPTLVCTHWHAICTNRERWEQAEQENEAARLQRLAFCARSSQYRWVDRIVAMAAIDDVAGLRAAWNGDGRKIAVGSLLKDYNDDDYLLEIYDDPEGGVDVREYLALAELDGRHGLTAAPDGSSAIENSLDLEIFSDMYGGPLEACEMHVQNVCFMNAAITGATATLAFLKGTLPEGSRFHPCEFVFNEAGDTLFSDVVRYACRHPTLTAPLRGLESLLDGAQAMHERTDHYGISDTMYHRVRGTRGNALHLAAARGHLPLVKLLVRSGMSLTRRSRMEQLAHFSPYSSIIDASKGHRPVEWARAHGHEEVVKYMEEELRRTRPRLPIASSCTERGTLVRFDARALFLATSRPITGAMSPSVSS